MQINKRQLRKWIAALDSGEYKQYTGGALNRGGGYCCLGVACKVLIPDENAIIDIDRLVGAYVNEQLYAPEWLKDINKDFQVRTGLALSVLNDCRGFTFPEIATLLELVYVHKILD